MHNCKTTRGSLLDLALDQTQANTSPPATAGGSDKSARLLAELAECGACQEEYATLRSVLGTAAQATRSALPAESFWSGYHSRLSQRIHHAAASESPAPRFQPRASVGVWSTLRRIAGASVRIPVPAAALMVLFFGLAMFLLMQTRSQAKHYQLTPSPVLETKTPVLETKTIAVPVVQERVVTHVVYLAKPRRFGAGQPERYGARNSAGSTAVLNQEPGKTAVNLSDFKPTDQVKLTIIKGSYHDEQ